MITVNGKHPEDDEKIDFGRPPLRRKNRKDTPDEEETKYGQPPLRRKRKIRLSIETFQHANLKDEWNP